MNIVDPILFHARLDPTALAIAVPGAARERVSYGMLARMIGSVGATALAAGLKPGEIAAIDVQDKIFHAALILGLARIGVVVLSARSPVLPKEIGVHAVIADSTKQYRNADRVIVADPSVWALGGDGAPRSAPPVGDEHPCRITLTSGTTGEARGILFSHRAVTERNARLAFARGERFARCTRFYCDLGFATDPGFRDMVHMLSKGGAIFYFGGDAESTMQGLGLYGVEGMMVSPQGLAEYLKFFEDYPEVSCRLDHILTSGATLSRSLSERVRARMCVNLFSTYGATETGGIAVAPAHVIADVPGAVGYVTPGAEVEIVDAAGRVLPAGAEGTVRVRTPQTVGGYVGNPPEAAFAFRDGWFYPGDFGVMRSDGLLVILGRDATVLNLGGDKVRPETVEEAVAAFPAVAQAAVFTETDQFGIARLVAAFVASAPVDEAALRRHCEARLGSALTPTRFIAVASLPYSSTGKLDRARLRDLGAH